MLLVVLGWLYLVIAGKGLLIRYDPMATSEAEPRFVESVACTYSSGVRTETVLSLGHARDAECARLYKFGSVPPCPTPLSSPLLCQEVPK
ncbi:MAG TPA: hypothetical protein VG742_03500 [Dongiaceae bacterium]|nr:hypothetical protein [Dongiaceae bacterium]